MPGWPGSVPAVGGGVLGHQDEFLDPGRGELFGLPDQGVQGPAAQGAPDLGDETEGAAMAAAFGDLQVGQMSGSGGVAGLDAAVGVGRGLMNQRGGAEGPGPGQELGQGGEVVHPDEQVDFREVGGQLRAVALHQAAGHHQAHLRPASFRRAKSRMVSTASLQAGSMKPQVLTSRRSAAGGRHR